MRLAAIDYGTVTTRLMVAEVTDGGVQVLLRKTTITHLGEGLAAGGFIIPAAKERILTVTRGYLTDIAALIDGDAAEKTVAIATSALRDATNSDEVSVALRELGVEVEIIAGAREAELSFIGAVSGFSSGEGSVVGKDILVVDIGGGSTEIIKGIVRAEAQSVQSKVTQAHSFDIGSRRVTDMFLQGDPYTAEELQQAREWITGQVEPFFTALESQPQQMLAVAGAATTVVSIRDQMQTYDAEQVHGALVQGDELAAITRSLASMTLQQRQSVIGLEADRSSVIVGGLLVLEAVLELSGLPAFTVSESDILQGVLLDYFVRQNG